MPIFSKKNGKRSFPFHIILQILVFAGLIGITALTLRPVQQAIQDQIRHIRDDLIGRAEAVVGRKIRYSSISPSIFGVFDIRNLRILGKEPDSEELFSVSRFRLSWSFWDLLKGKPLTVRSVLIDRPQINLDLERDRDLLELLFSLDPDTGGSRPSLAGIFPEHVLFRIRAGQCQVQNRRDRFRIEDLTFDAQAADELISLDGKWNALVSLRSPFAEPVSARISIRATGIISTDLEEVNAVVTVDSLAGDRFQARSFTFGCSLQNSMLSVRKMGDRLPFDFFLDYGIEEGNLAARLNCNEFTPKDLLTLSGAWKEANRWLALAATGAASLERDRQGNIRYRVDIAGGLPSGPAASFEIKAGGDEKVAQIEEFRLSAPGNVAAQLSAAPLFQGNIAFRGSMGLKPFSPRGKLFLENFSLSGETGLSAELGVNTRGREIGVLGERIRIGRLVMGVLDISLFPSGGDLGFVVSAREFRESSGAARSGSFSLEGSLNYAVRWLEASCSLDSVSAADLAEMSRPFVKEPLPPASADLLRNVSLTTEVFFTTDFKRLLYNAPRVEAAFGQSDADPALVLSVSGTDKRLEISESRFVLVDQPLLFSGYADYSNPLDLNFSLKAHYQDISYNMEGRVLDRKQISAQGSYGFQMYITSTDTGAYSGYIEGREITVPVRGLPAHLSFYTSVRYNSRDFWSFDLDNLEVTDIASPAGPGYMRITGGADQDGAHFPVVYYRDSISPLDGRADFSWAQNFSGFSGTLSVEERREPRSGDNRAVPDVPNSLLERYLLWASFTENRLDILVSGSRMRLGRALDNTGSALADGDLRFIWDPERS